MTRWVNDRKHASNTAQLIRADAPQHPQCFDSQEQWVEYLLEVERDADTVVSRPKAGIARVKTDVNYCADCTPSYQREMLTQRRCNPQYPPTETPRRTPLDAAMEAQAAPVGIEQGSRA